MQLLAFSSLLAFALASPIPEGGYGGEVIGEGVLEDVGVGISGGFAGSEGIGGGGYECGPNQVLNALGQCVEPILTRNTFFYNAPPAPYVELPAPIVPTPRVDYDLVFLRSPEVLPPPEPIVVPANERRTAVYLLNKNQPIHPQKVIEVPAAPQQSPEVFYVNYDHGDNPILPGGISLKEAITAAEVQQGQLIGGGGGVGNIAVGSGHGGGGYSLGVGIGSEFGGGYNDLNA